MGTLSPIDQKILDLLAQGIRDAEVCQQLQISKAAFAKAIKRIEALAEAEAHNNPGRQYEMALRIRSENKLRSLESRFHALMSILPEAVLVVDGRTGTIKETNDLACQLFGYSKDEFLGRSVEELVPAEQRAIHPAYRLGFLSSIRKREMGYHPPIFGVRSDGTQVEVAIALTATSADDDVMVVCTERTAWRGKGESTEAVAAE